MTERKSFLLRMDPALWAEIERWAQQELRSVNGQIEYLLKQALVARKRMKDEPRDRRES
ncbi:MAG: hypothetical protein ABR964_14580 [Tepidisphaeraceae bacterium]|jgi:hypothetical protein